MRELTNIDPEKLYVYAAPGEEFKKTAEPLMGIWYDLLERVTDFDLGQIVLHNNDWLGALLWRRPLRQYYALDRYIGWHLTQQAARLPLVLECVAFQPRLHVPGRQSDFGRIALDSAIISLPLDWAEEYGYQPLLASAELDPGNRLPPIFEANGWKRITPKNPRGAISQYVMELAPGAKEMLSARHLDKAFTGGASSDGNGLLPLPIRNELLPSLFEAFKDIPDIRERNRHYRVESLLAVAFIGLIAGCDSFGDVVRFSSRFLSGEQAQLLGLPYDEKTNRYDLPGYYVYYRLFHRLDCMLVAENFINWTASHIDKLPEVLRPGGDMMRDILLTFANKLTAPPTKHSVSIGCEPLVGIDPESGCLKRDEHGYLFE
jgi:hypothetical protein